MGDGCHPGRLWLPIFVAAGALAGSVALALPHGSLSGAMGAHILLMNVAAPLVALLLRHARPHMVGRAGLAGSLWAATLVQLAVLWAAHLPVILAHVRHDAAAHALLQLALLAAALWFWLAVVAQSGPQRWRALWALLITGKLVCLLGILLALAPRVLYPQHDVHAGLAAGDAADLLADQQLAGLLMIIACPLTYVLAGVIVAARWLQGLGARNTHAAAHGRQGA